jgi:hypothetical protein
MSQEDYERMTLGKRSRDEDGEEANTDTEADEEAPVPHVTADVTKQAEEKDPPTKVVAVRVWMWLKRMKKIYGREGGKARRLEEDGYVVVSMPIETKKIMEAWLEKNKGRRLKENRLTDTFLSSVPRVQKALYDTMVHAHVHDGTGYTRDKTFHQLSDLLANHALNTKRPKNHEAVRIGTLSYYSVEEE